MTTKEKIKKFQTIFNPIFLKEVKNLLDEQKKFHPTVIDNQIEESIINYCKTGKRIRPFLIHFFSEKDITHNDILHITLASELFHLAALLQDDVIDNSLVRRNVPTLNAVGAEIAVYNKNLGDHIGILLGDVFWTAGMEKAALLPQTIFKEFITMIQRTIRGQYLDALGMNEEYGTSSKENVFARNNLKTAWYTFTSPARIGYMLHNNFSEEKLLILTNIIRELGLLFQIRDDIIDCIDENSGKPLFGDIFENQTTWVTFYLQEQYPDIYKKIIQTKNKLTVQDLQKIFTNIDLETPYITEFNKVSKNIDAIDNQYSDIKEKSFEVLKLLTLK